MLAAPAAYAQAKELNIYSARHYQTDQQLYDGFAKAHNVKINRVDSDDAGVMQRLRAEGAASPADVVLMVDPGPPVPWPATTPACLPPIKSSALEKAGAGAVPRCGHG